MLALNQNLLRRIIFILLVYTQAPAFGIPRDTYPRNYSIDILNYAFYLTLSDVSDEIVGEAKIEILFKKAGVTSIQLDLIKKSDDLEGRGMTVLGVTNDSKELNFVHNSETLIVTLDKAPAAGQRFTISIKYAGIPASGLKIAPNKYGDRTFFSDNWPNRARNWLPTLDHPYDKATCEFLVTAPDHYQVISNGLKTEETNLEDGLKMTHWKQSVPICTWLYVLGVADFAVQYYDTFEGKSLQTWVYKQDRDAGFYDFAVPTKQTLAFFSDYVGPFAYEKLANIQSNSVGGGMEAASAIFYGDNSVTGDRSIRWRNVIIHEVAHQWFGNAVTESDWDDVWLSEGFATYFTLLFREYAYGRDDFVEGLKNARGRVYNFYKDHKDYRLVHDNLSDMSKVTTGQTYQKGAWILHMLRNKIGDEAFQKGIQSYYTRFFNGNASTEEFRQEMETASNADLDMFFRQWLYQGGNIVLDGGWRYNEKKNTVDIDLTQVQDDGFTFTFPVDIGIYYDGKDLPEVHSFEVTEHKHTFSAPVEKIPLKVVLDPRTVLLAQWRFVER